MYNYIIKNGLVVDGTGKAPVHADVAINDDQVVEIKSGINASASVEIDATGLVVAPGFIDMQNHADAYWQLFESPEMSGSLGQGFTTVIVGQCGSSLAPLLTPDAIAGFQKWRQLSGTNISWSSFSEMLDALSHQPLGVNVGSLVGFGTLRRGLVGSSTSPMDEGSLKAASKVLTESLEAGAFGLSMGLSYSHEGGASEEELLTLASCVAKADRLLSVHLRSEGDKVLEAATEALELASKSGARLQVSHLKARGQEAGKYFEPLISLFEGAYHRGAKVAFDLYPYSAALEVLANYLPRWATGGSRGELLAHLAEPTQRRKALDALAHLPIANFTVASSASGMGTTGKTIGKIAGELGTTTGEALLSLIEHGGGDVLVVDRCMREEDVHTLLAHPLSIVASDGAGYSKGTRGQLVHPRSFGTAPRFLHQVLSTKALTLEAAVHKLTGAPAIQLGLKKRGTLAVDQIADLVVFNPETVQDRATFENPFQGNTGIEHVFVGGRAALGGHAESGAFGRVLRAGGTS